MDILSVALKEKIFIALPDSKTLLLSFQIVIAIANSFALGFEKTIPHIAIAVGTALVVDIALKFFLTKKIVFSKSAAITGMFVGLILTPESWLYAIPASAIGIILKHFVRFNFLNVFNPAFSGLFITLLLFPSQAIEAWWGYGIPWLVVLAGLLVCWKADRLYASFAFFISYFVLFSISLFFNSQMPFNQAIGTAFAFLPGIFGFLMLTDPITSPPKHKPQIAYGFIVALVSVLLLALNFGLFLYAALFAGNALRFELSKRLK